MYIIVNIPIMDKPAGYLLYTTVMYVCICTCDRVIHVAA